jgi:hypothetical protein
MGFDGSLYRFDVVPGNDDRIGEGFSRNTRRVGDGDGVAGMAE